jgi:AAA+ ATPase superfamily predicted ATPase
MDEVYSITVIEGPSKSGKSTTVQQMINGRANTVYINIREKTEEIPILVAEAFGAISEKKENLKDLALGTVTGLVKSALVNIYEKREYLEPERKHEIPGKLHESNAIIL